MTDLAVGELAAALRAAGVEDVDDSALARSLYASDASIYRIPPTVVVRPRETGEILAALSVARSAGSSITMRGAGTSIAGNAIGPGIVVDTSKHLDKVLALDPEARTARVQPGVVHAVLQRAAAPHGLRFGPDPSTHTRCTIGGMIGNNACGSRALGYGRTCDNVVELTAVDGTGRMLTGPDADPAVRRALDALAEDHLAEIRTRFGRFTRQVSGYSLEHLLPERGRNLDRFLVGSEGTLGLVLDATVRLVADAPARALAVLAYGDMAEAADAVPGLLASGVALVACEGLDARIVEVVRAAKGSVPDLPDGAGWLFAEVTGADSGEAEALAARVLATARAEGSRAGRVVSGAAEQAALWRIREDGAGLAARSLTRPAYSGWEDAAVPPEQLGAYLRDFDRLLVEHGLDGVPYGHFGDGCVHVRIDFTFGDGGTAFRRFLEESADMLRGYGGSLSGEHGDGRARSALLPRMYDEESLRLFGAVKAICDPDDLLNPGVLVRPDPVDAALRPARPHRRERTALRLIHDDGDLASAAHRCTGVGKCRADNTGAGGVMCPSFLATRDEKDSTRGRARVLQEALDAGAGALLDGLADPAVGEALDLCLACKGCARDCPTGIDMATYKAEALHQTYRGRRRPRSHYTLGRLPMWSRLAAPATGLLNASLRVGPFARAAKAVAGIDQRRSLPSFATTSLRRTARASQRAGADPADRPDVWIWADSFTDGFLPGGGLAALRIFEAAGLRAEVIDARACCGLTWISTGQLDSARRILARTVATLHPYVASGVPVIGLEPSCLATLRSDAVELLDDPRAVEVARGMRTLAEHLSALAATGSWEPPSLAGETVVAQPHCHHHAVLGWAADQALLELAGAEVVRVGGCCGLAGNFGVEKGHYEVSVAVAETALLPAVRAHPDALVLADGMSCRVQLDDLAGVPAMHLAELLASRIDR